MTWFLAATTAIAADTPLIFKDASGRNCIIDKTPQGIVSLVPPITEILFRIGAGDAVRNGRMIYFPCNLTCRPASRTGYLISCLAASIYGDPSKEPIRVAFSQPLPRVLEMALGAMVGGIRANKTTTGNK
jgi:hypothetical protein